MTVFLVRHASAGSRRKWAGDDLDRPLDGDGRIQAAAVAEMLQGEPIDELLTSEALRCRQTLDPLSLRLGIDIVETPALTEGAPIEDLSDLLRSRAGTATVMCSHGDLIPEIIRRLIGEGMAVAGRRGSAKGSVWAIEFAGSRAARGSYVARPALAFREAG